MTAALGGVLIRSVFQPVVELGSGHVVGFEALTRGPAGHRWETPGAFFAEARRRDELTALDAACVVSALGAAAAAGLVDPWTLLLNLEPESLSAQVLTPQVAAGVGAKVVVELTERALTSDPAALLVTVARVRELGWGVALDDVGVNTDSLALLPLLAPDLIKLDASLVQNPTSQHTARVFSAVAAAAERTGATVLAEGVETEEHLAAARGLGAQLGQGWLFGRPEPLPQLLPPMRGRPLTITTGTDRGTTARTPFDVASAARPVTPADRDLLTALSHHLERQAKAVDGSCLVLATFQTAAAFDTVADRYAALAAAHAYVAAFAADLPITPAPGVPGVALHPDEPLTQEWDLVVLGPHYAALLAARRTDTPTLSHPIEPSDVHDYVLTHDRDLVVAAAHSLMARISTSPADPT